MQERRVGIRILKSKLSEYMDVVKAGTTIVVTLSAGIRSRESSRKRAHSRFPGAVQCVGKDGL